MEFKYEGLDQTGKPQSGVVNANTQDAAIDLVQRKGITITSIAGGQQPGLMQSFGNLSFFEGISSRNLVLLSRQIATLFEAQVSALRIFRLLAEQADKPYVRGVLTQISDDLQGGNSISKSLARHPKVFSAFYVNMVRAGEESGKLDQTFLFLADYIDRSFELTAKARNALIYPAFIMLTFVGVMTLMLTVVIPKIGGILTDSGQALPVYTQIILGLSTFLVDFGIFILVAIIVGVYFLWRYIQTPVGHMAVSRLQLSLPYIGTLYQKLYLARIADNMHVMLTSGIAVVRALEITPELMPQLMPFHLLESVSAAVMETVIFSPGLTCTEEPPLRVADVMLTDADASAGTKRPRLIRMPANAFVICLYGSTARMAHKTQSLISSCKAKPRPAAGVLLWERPYLAAVRSGSCAADARASLVQAAGSGFEVGANAPVLGGRSTSSSVRKGYCVLACRAQGAGKGASGAGSRRVGKLVKAGRRRTRADAGAAGGAAGTEVRCRVTVSERDRAGYLLEGCDAVCIATLGAGAVEGDEHDGREDADDGDDHQELDEGEAL